MIPSVKKTIILTGLFAFWSIPSVAWAHYPTGLVGACGGILADLLAVPTIICLVIFYHKKKKRPDHVSPVIGLVIFNYVVYVLLLLLCIDNSNAFFRFGFPSFSMIIIHICLHWSYQNRLKAMQSGDAAETPSIFPPTDTQTRIAENDIHPLTAFAPQDNAFGRVDEELASAEMRVEELRREYENAQKNVEELRRERDELRASVRTTHNSKNHGEA